MLRIYVAGPMTGYPELNFNAFHAEAARLRAAGHDVVNPAEINPDKAKTWKECMRSDIAHLVTCDAVQLLPGWENSRGALIEERLARDLGMLVLQPGAITPANELEAIQYAALQASVQARNHLALAEAVGTH
jgi:hypothetical protein